MVPLRQEVIPWMKLNRKFTKNMRRAPKQILGIEILTTKMEHEISTVNGLVVHGDVIILNGHLL